MMTTARKYKKIPRFALAFAVLSAGVLSSGAASASGILVARFGGEKGHPTTDSPTAIYYNPAGLALGHGTRVFIEGTGAFRLVTYDRPEGAIDNVLDPGEAAEGTPPDGVS